MKTQYPENVYGRDFTLLLPLEKVECWNQTDDSYGNIPAGHTIHVCHANDATRTTILASKEGMPIFHKDGTPNKSLGYRFIVPNTILGPAIGQPMPATTPDLIGDIIAVESGPSTRKQRQHVIRALKGTSLGAKMKHRYGS